MKKLAVAITGASGSIYAKILLDKIVNLKEQLEDAGLVMSDNAKFVWKHELKNEDFINYKLPVYKKDDFTAPFASGSAGYDSLIICPCSMGTMARIASGVSDDLITRAADVMLKERKKLILVIRDTPYNLIHIQNMKVITEAGGVICPATPSFYSLPENFEQLAATVVDRALQLAGFDLQTFRWGEAIE
ncbi:MAG: UbiX family flavin prenyltransferase [Chitinophagales bacterium]|nr:UbiX family flavin prenyltransferase [Chitinophagales bacterium]